MMEISLTLWKVVEICQNDQIIENQWVLSQPLMEKSLNLKTDIALTKFVGGYMYFTYTLFIIYWYPLEQIKQENTLCGCNVCVCVGHM